MRIEDLLREISPEYYGGSNYNNWLHGFKAGAEQKRWVEQEYCYWVLKDIPVAQTEYRKEVICYLLQDPSGSNRRCKYTRYVDMWLYMSFQRGEFLGIEGITKEEVLYVLKKNYRHHEDYEFMAEEIEDYYEANPMQGEQECAECVETEEEEKVKFIPGNFSSDFDVLCERLESISFGEKKGERFEFTGSSSEYAYLVECLTYKYWGISERCKWLELEDYFTHDDFKMSSARNKRQKWVNDRDKRPPKWRNISRAVKNLKIDIPL